MPELPEVETTARGLRREVVGLTIVSVDDVDWPRMVPNAPEELLRAALVGRRVAGAGRRGKYLTISTDDGQLLVIHRKMAGNVLLQSAESPAPRHTHLSVGLSDGRALRLIDARKFSRVYLFHDSEDAGRFFSERLGLDPLDELTPATLRQTMARRRGRLKSVLLDQRAFPGMGNLYTDEVLWRARLHPLRSADSLTRAELARLFESIGAVLAEAIEARGTSISDYRDQSGQPGEYQQRLQVYGRDGEPCPRCGRAILKTWVGARGTHFCRGCQRPPVTRA